MDSLSESGRWAFWVCFSIFLFWRVSAYTPEIRRNIGCEVTAFLTLVGLATGLTALVASISAIRSLFESGFGVAPWHTFLKVVLGEYVVYILLILWLVPSVPLVISQISFRVRYWLQDHGLTVYTLANKSAEYFFFLLITGSVLYLSLLV